MQDICLISRDAGHLMKMRDCPADCGTVDTYGIEMFQVCNILCERLGVGREPMLCAEITAHFDYVGL